MRKTTISVAMCTYNGARFLPEQLESIASQTKLPDELIVCDDDSTDGSVELIEKFACHAPFPVKLEINKKNLGSTKNFERAISFCRGEFVALADQDDVWESQKLDTISAALEEHPEAGYVFSDAELIDEFGVRTERKLWHSIGFGDSLLRDFVKPMQPAILLRINVVTGATMAFRSSLNNVLLPISPYFVHDAWIALIASSVGWPGLPIRKTLVRHRQHPGQQTGIRRRSFLETMRRARQDTRTKLNVSIKAFQDARDRLSVAARLGHKFSENYMCLIDEKIAHCTERAAVHSAHGAEKVGKMLKEALTGRYRRFSNSWQSAVGDLCS